MRRYHFDLVDINSVTDVTGAILDNDAHAIKVAIALARDARKCRPGLMKCGYILVRTDSGEISRLALDRPPDDVNGG